MTALRFYPWAAQREWLKQVNQAYEASANDANWTPSVDIEEYKDKFVIHADVPGVDLASVEITLEKGVLKLSGARQVRVENAEVVSRRSERSDGRFQRSFTLPDTADGDAISASGKNGVLEVVIPKRAQVQPRRISVTH
ncbi:MAG: Hsp20/alpha crystallin family protein [Rhizobium sp.]|nr:MAG: Hsp20/alpha crystallin family protein [Rhizobium sp.]